MSYNSFGPSPLRCIASTLCRKLFVNSINRHVVGYTGCTGWPVNVITVTRYKGAIQTTRMLNRIRRFMSSTCRFSSDWLIGEAEPVGRFGTEIPFLSFGIIDGNLTPQNLQALKKQQAARLTSLLDRVPSRARADLSWRRLAKHFFMQLAGQRGLRVLHARLLKGREEMHVWQIRKSFLSCTPTAMAAPAATVHRKIVPIDVAAC